MGRRRAGVSNGSKTGENGTPVSSTQGSNKSGARRAIDVTTDTQESGDVALKNDLRHLADTHGSQVNLRTAQKTAKEPLHKGTLGGCAGPLDKFTQSLAAAVCLSKIARLYGLDAVKLEAQAQGETDSGESRVARADLDVLQGIVRYLNKQRASSVRWSGTEFLVVLHRIPCRILTIEQQRFDALYRANHKCSHLYTNYKQGTIFRCPLPECGGATINQTGIKKTLVAHHKAYHKDLANIQFTFKIETVRGWDYLSIPERGDKRGPVHQASFVHAGVSRGESEGEREGPTSQHLADGCSPSDKDRATANCEISTLRQALLGRNASTDQFETFRCRREKTVGVPEKQGIFCVRKDGASEQSIISLNGAFTRGPDLRTVPAGQEVLPIEEEGG